MYIGESQVKRDHNRTVKGDSLSSSARKMGRQRGIISEMEPTDLIQLPERFEKKLKNKRDWPNMSSSLDCVYEHSEGSSEEFSSGTSSQEGSLKGHKHDNNNKDNADWNNRNSDMTTAIKWIKQEIVSVSLSIN